MSKDEYFVVTTSEGEVTINTFTKEELEENLDECYWGSNISFKKVLDVKDLNYWEENEILIIKGQIIVPDQKKVVVNWKVD